MENHESAKFRKIALRVFEKLPRARAYALGDAALEGLGAFCKAWHEAGNSLSNIEGDDGKTGEDHFGEVLQELGAFEPSLFQPPPGEAPTLPEWPRHPLTGELMPNPFAKESASLAAQSKLMARDPALAKAMKAAVENPWQYYFDLEEEKQKREHVAAVKYGEQDHARNPFVEGKGGLDEQSEFVKRNDPVRVEIFKREAKPASLPFVPGNEDQTVRGKLYTKNPRLYQWTENARATCQRWHDERITALKAAEAQARADREALEKQLQREQTKRPAFGFEHA
jgi:hypothetical protein